MPNEGFCEIVDASECAHSLTERYELGTTSAQHTTTNPSSVTVVPPPPPATLSNCSPTTTRSTSPSPIQLPVGYNPAAETLLTTDFPRLNGRIHADYAGAPPPPRSLLTATTTDLLSNLYINPHSEQGLGDGPSLQAVDNLRSKTLEMCCADPAQYVCVLTSGATASLKLVAEIFPWSGESVFMYTQDNHTSVLGMRNVAMQHAAATAAVRSLSCSTDITTTTTTTNNDTSTTETTTHETNNQHYTLHMASPLHTQIQPNEHLLSNRNNHNTNNNAAAVKQTNHHHHLFAFPLESNFDGCRYDVNLATAIQQQTALVSYNEDDSQITMPLSEFSYPKNTKNEQQQQQQNSGCRWCVLIDAAKACATRPPDLSTHTADFVVLSYYKMFGYPTGLGALIIRKNLLPALTATKSYFGGGTISASLATEPFYQRRPGVLGLEDGTLNFLSIPAALHGFEFIKKNGGYKTIDTHACAVATLLRHQLQALRHANNTPVCTIYTRNNNISSYTTIIDPQKNNDINNRSSVVTFSLQDDNQKPIGYRQVERLASLEHILLRTGCLCNPGACSSALKLTNTELRANFEAGHVCWGDTDVVNGKHAGVVRVSFGFVSTVRDVESIVGFINKYFVSSIIVGDSEDGENCEGSGNRVSGGGHSKATSTTATSTTTLSGGDVAEKSSWCIQSLYVYPIKSCPGFQNTSWPLGPQGGLLLDRQWALVDDGGQTLTVKRCRALHALRPVIDLNQQLLIVHYQDSSTGSGTGGDSSKEEGVPPLCVSISHLLPQSALTMVNVCREKQERQGTITGDYCGINVAGLPSTPEEEEEDINAWFSTVLGVSCRLIQHIPRQHRENSIDTTSNTGGASTSCISTNSFANSAQLLLVSHASLYDLYTASGLQKQQQQAESFDVFTQRFRPNIIIITTPKSTTSNLSSLESDENFDGGGEFGCYSEERWKGVCIGGVELAAVGPCMRCDVVCKHPVTATKDEGLLMALAKRKKLFGGARLSFGLLLNRHVMTSMDDNARSDHNDSDVLLNKGDVVAPRYQ